MSVLTEREIRSRLRSGELVISPILDEEAQIRDGSVNLRLGTEFIITKRTMFGTITPQELSGEKVREFQDKIRVPFSGPLVLHPGQLILSSTFEFLGLPKNLSGTVLSRSSYGRLGLMVATATYIHPCWKGCLTLELYNYGDAPIELTCGAQIAQLVLSDALELDCKPQGKIPVGPEFVVMKDDDDWKMLSKFAHIEETQS